MCTDFGPDQLRFAGLIPERVHKSEYNVGFQPTIIIPDLFSCQKTIPRPRPQGSDIKTKTSGIKTKTKAKTASSDIKTKAKTASSDIKTKTKAVFKTKTASSDIKTKTKAVFKTKIFKIRSRDQDPKVSSAKYNSNSRSMVAVQSVVVI